MRYFLILLALFNLTNFVIADQLKEPTRHLEAGIYIVLLDLSSDKTYLVDLEINLLEFVKNPVNKKFNLLKTINKLGDEPIKSMETFRWSLVGGIDDSFRNIGHIGSYRRDKSPNETKNWRLRSRIKRLNYLLKAQPFDDRVKIISVRGFEEVGHWNDLWQGSYDSLEGGNNMMGKTGGSELDIWTQFIHPGKGKPGGKNFEPPDWGEIITQKIGDVKLMLDGELTIEITS